MDFSRRGLEIGPFDLFGVTINPMFHWYGLIIVAGILSAAAVASWMAKRDDKDSDHVWNGLIWVVFFAIVFARLWHVLFPSVSSARTAEWYLTHPLDLHEGPLIIWSGGLSIFGAVIGGAIGTLIYTYRQKLDVLSWIDIAAVVVPLGQAIGRWGNYVNEELYGKPTDLPWGLRIDNPPTKYIEHTHFHPLFLYESLWCLLTFAVLLFVWLRYRERFKQGDFLLLYLIAYSFARFFLEFLRIEVTEAGGINVSQAFCVIAGGLSLALLAYRHRDALRRRSSGESERSEEPA